MSTEVFGFGLRLCAFVSWRRGIQQTGEGSVIGRAERAEGGTLTGSSPVCNMRRKTKASIRTGVLSSAPINVHTRR